jgi:hypothetical protein
MGEQTKKSEKGFGHNVIVGTVSYKLRELMPKADIDFDVIAEALVTATDIAAVHKVEEREQALQSALHALMEYYNGVTRDLHERIVCLEREHENDKLTIARIRDPSRADGRPMSGL